jgi:hypothetical protein
MHHVAGKWLVARNVADAQNTVGLFPTEHGGGVVFSLAETNAQNRHYSAFFGRLAAAYADVLAQNLSLRSDAGLPVARACMVPIAHLFFDRTLRVSRLLSTNQEIIGVLKTKSVSIPERCEDLSFLASESFDFNQLVLNQLAPAFGLDVAELEATEPSSRLPEFSTTYKNHLFYLKRPSLLRRALRRAQTMLSRHTGRVIAYGLTQTHFPSLDRGLYGFGGFASFADQALLDAPPPDFANRRRLFSALSSCSSDIIKDCLGQWVDMKNWDSLNQTFIEMMVSFLPTTLLEGLETNLKRASKELAAFSRVRTIYSTSFSLHSRAVILNAAARTMGMEVISSQHGGHYGYMKQQTIALEAEFPFSNRWVTWGWSSTEEHPNASREKFVPLPSPWMSERVTEWAKVLSDKARFSSNKLYDIAFMPNKVYSYCPAPSGAHATGNFLEEFCTSVVDLVEAVTTAGQTILHKPYGSATVALMPDTLHKLSLVGGRNYQLSMSLDKGLHPVLVRDVGLFVWDQPGTGFLECLAANIPTLVYWPRIYNCENEDAAPLFAAMEAHGLIHRESRSLASSALEFKQDPRGWWENPPRRESALAFMDFYCRCSPDWHLPWKQFITTIR